MNNPYVVGLASGLAAALLFATITTGSAFAVILFYLASMPLFIAGLGWGWITAAVGGLVATVVLGLAINLTSASIFSVSVAAPVIILCYRFFLSRTNPDGTVDWYPPGELLVWICGIASFIVTVGVIAMSAGAASPVEAFAPLMSAGIKEMADSITNADQRPSDEEIEMTARALAQLLPPTAAAFWVITTVINMFIAGRVVRGSGLLQRPWPELKSVTIPQKMSLVFVAALALSFVGGYVGVAGTIVTATLMLAFALQGLAIVHVITGNQQSRGIILFALYLAILVLGWPLLVMTILGLLEPNLRLRERHITKKPPSSPPPPPPASST